ncbi:MAG TPA: hypothetical protein VIJ46_05445 [Rhabdochlamydiaceae bacterium]
MLKLDVTSLTMQGVYDRLNADCATYFPAKPAAAAATEVELDATAKAAQEAAAKKEAEDLKTTAALFKGNVKIGFEYIDRPALAADTLETIERLDLKLVGDIKKMHATAVGHFNGLVDLNAKVEALSPTPKGWLGGAAKLPEKKTVAEAAAEAKEVKPVQSTYEEAITASKGLRQSMMNTVGLIEFVRGTLVVQLRIFQHANSQPINQEELAAVKADCDSKRAQFKEVVGKTETLLTQLNDAIKYTQRPPISAQDLETLKRMNPEFVATLEKAQKLCLEQQQHLIRHQVVAETALGQMRERMGVLEGEESRLVTLIKAGAPLSGLRSGLSYYWPNNVDQTVDQILGKPVVATATAIPVAATEPAAETDKK